MIQSQINLKNTFVEVTDNVSLTELAYKYYGDSRLWTVIADANEEFDIFEVREGTIELKIPTKGEALNRFKDVASDKLNSVVGDLKDKLPHQKVSWLL